MKAIIISISTQDSYWANFFFYFLGKMRLLFDDIYIISKFSVAEEVKRKINKMCKELFECIGGDDFERWNYVLKEIRDHKESYSYISLSNDSIYGPINNFFEIWNEMQSQNRDFWGITYYEESERKYLQTYFITFKAQIAVGELIDFLENSKNTDNKEYFLTSYLEQKGLNHDAYIHLKHENKHYHRGADYLLYYTNSLIQNYKLPFIPRYLFRIPDDVYQLFGDGMERKRIFQSINDHYPVKYIFDDQIKQQNMYDLIHNMGLIHVIEENKEIKCQEKVALFVYLYYSEDFDYYMEKMQTLPLEVDVFIYTDDLQKVKKIEILSKDIKNNLKVFNVNSKGREWGVLLNEVKKELCKYKIACFMHDKSFHSFEFPTQAFSFRDLLWDNLLPSYNGILDIISYLENNKHIGLVVPPVIKCGTYFKFFMNFWTANYDNVVRLLHDLKIDNSLISKDKTPFSIGGMFWFKTEALTDLFSKNYEDFVFEEEPLPNDGTINHALERVLPYVAQNAGYYSSIVILEEYICTDWLLQSNIIRYMGNKTSNNLNSLFDFVNE